MENKKKDSDPEQNRPEKKPAVTHTVLKTPANISTISGLHPSDKPINAYDLSADETSDMDVYPAAQAFWQMTLSKLETLPEDETLYVFLGESHTAPSQKMAQMAILSLASAWRDAARPGENRNFIHTRELPFNEIYNLAQRYDAAMPRSLKYKPEEIDPKGGLAARALWANSPYFMAPLASAHVLAHSLTNDIPVVFTDCSLKKGFNRIALDIDDGIWPEAAKLLKRKESELSYHIPAIVGSGIAWRNASMVLRAEQAAKKFKARLVLQQGGSSHLCGSERLRAPYSDSWLSLQEKAGHTALGLYMAHNRSVAEEELVKAARKKAASKVMIIRGLDEEEHTSDSARRERIYLGCLRQAFSGPADYLPQYYDPPSRKVVKAEIKQAVKKAVASLPPESKPPAQGGPA